MIINKIPSIRERVVHQVASVGFLSYYCMFMTLNHKSNTLTINKNILSASFKKKILPSNILKTGW